MAAVSVEPWLATWRPPYPVDVAATLAPLRRGGGDPAYRIDTDGAVWRTTRMDSGPATLRLRGVGGLGRGVTVQAWGAGGEEALACAPDMLGGRDSAEGFDPRLPVLREAARRRPGLRIPRTGRVLEALVPAVLEQKVTGTEARRSWRELLHRYGEPAPGPAPSGMRVPPAAGGWARVPSWEWHRAGVDDKRARTIVAAARVAERLEQTVALPVAEATGRLMALPGIGIWTAAEVTARAHGDTDSLSVGDYHLAPMVGWALLGRPIDDAEMVELLAPWRPHRYRVVRLLEAIRVRVPRRGPRLASRDYRTI